MCQGGSTGKSKKIEPTPNGIGSILARLKGFEPLTYWSVASHSIQLSYKRIRSRLNAQTL